MSFMTPEERTCTMKIAIPSEAGTGLESMRSGHFGHAPYFTLVTFDDDMNVTGVESIKNVDHDEVGCGGVIDFVSGLDVDGILAAGMGYPPFSRFTSAGVTVYADTTEPNVGRVVEMFAAGDVDPMDPDAACRH